MEVLGNEEEKETASKKLHVPKSLPGNVDSESGCQHVVPGKKKAQGCHLSGPVFRVALSKL